MPIYLAHGFRWPRDGFAGIRVHAIVNQLEDVSVEYIQNGHSRDALLSSLRTQYPHLLKPLEIGKRRLDFLEQYDPEDVSVSAVSQPYAFVCDWVVMIAGGNRGQGRTLFVTNATDTSTTQTHRSSPVPPTAGQRQSLKVRAKTQPMSIAAPFNSPATISALSINIDEMKADSPALSTEAWDALAELRDKLADGEKIGWWVVYNGDPDRDYPSSDTETGEDEEEEDSETQTETGDTNTRREKSQRESTATTMSATSTDSKSEMEEAHRVRSPTGGRMPPPIPPPPPPSTQVPRSPIQVPSNPVIQNTTKPLPMRPPQNLEEARAQARESPKTLGLRKKIFGSGKK